MVPYPLPIKKQPSFAHVVPDLPKYNGDGGCEDCKRQSSWVWEDEDVLGRKTLASFKEFLKAGLGPRYSRQSPISGSQTGEGRSERKTETAHNSLKRNARPD